MRLIGVVLLVAVTTGVSSVSFEPDEEHAQIQAYRLAADICPTPTTCPAGFSGRYCDITICDEKGDVPSPHPTYGFPIDIEVYKDECQGYQSVPVDSAVEALYMMIDGRDAGAWPSLTLTDANGKTIVPTTLPANDSKTLIQKYEKIAAGKYNARFTASLPCVYHAHADTQFTVGIGFTSGSRAVNNDFPDAKIQARTPSFAVAHLFNFHNPGYATAMEIYEDATFLHSYDHSERYRCAYEHIYGPIQCSEESTYYYKIFGIDSNGFDFQRTNLVQCVAPSSTTSRPSTTSSGPCEHGGQLDPISGFCICPAEWTGTTCHDIVCFNGGSVSSDNKCVCNPNYAGYHCQWPQCIDQSPVPIFSPNQRSLAIVFQNTPSMATELAALKKYVAELLETFEQHHKYFITQYSLHTFDETSVKTWVVTDDAFQFIEFVLHLEGVNGTDAKCNKQTLSGVAEALNYAYDYGFVFVLTDSPDGSSLNDTFKALDLAENTKAQINFWVTGGRCGNHSEYQIYDEFAEFSGGQDFLLSGKEIVADMFNFMPSIYQDANIYDTKQPDCTQTRTSIVQIDSHTVAFHATVHGNNPTIKITTPDGSRYPINPLVNDPLVQVAEVINLCPDGFLQYGHDCYQGNVQELSWDDAFDVCRKQNATLVTVLLEDKQDFLDKVTGAGRDYWIGLNDKQIEGRFLWDSMGDPLPLGHYYLNWADGQPDDNNRTQNCVATVHNKGENTIGKWDDRACSEKFAFVCQKHAYDEDNNRLPAGNWKIEYSTTDGGHWGKSCELDVHAQSDLQVYYGFAQSQFNDFPAREPLQNINNNYLVANVTNLRHHGAEFDSTQFWSYDNNLLGSTDMTLRSHCSYDHVSEPWKCPAHAFRMAMIGHDEQGFTWQRLRSAICLTSAGPEPKQCLIDIVVVVDSSESVSYQNFMHVKEFIAMLANALVFDQDNSVQLGGLVYNDQIRDLWALDQYRTQADLIRHLDNIPQTTGLTDTAWALTNARSILLGSGSGRDGAKKLVIVFSDGWHNTGGDPVAIADQMRHDPGAQFLCVGVNGINGYLYPQHYEELLGIAGGDKNMVLNVTGISGFSGLLPYVLDRLPCPEISTTTASSTVSTTTGPSTTTTHPPYKCYGDITFIVGTTERTGPLIQAMMQMVLNVSSIIGAQNDGSHIALVHFSSPDDRTNVSFDLSNTNTLPEISQFIETTDWNKYLGVSDIDLGLRYALSNVFTEGHGDRNDVPNYSILISDGFYDQDTNCCPEPFSTATALRGVSDVWALAIGPEPEWYNLDDICASVNKVYPAMYNKDLAESILEDIQIQCGAVTTPSA